MTTMTVVEARAWKAFSKVVHNFLGNKKADNYIELVQELFLSLQVLGCRMSIKVHYLHSHLSEFPANLGDVSEEQGERFHQDVKVMEERYQGRWNCNMMADYCWSLMRDAVHKRSATKRKFLMPYVTSFVLNYALDLYNRTDCCHVILLLFHVFFAWFCLNLLI